MPQSRSQIAALLASAGMQPRHRFGQNFMVDPNLVRAIAAAGNPAPHDLILEVGPGTGTLTESLLDSGASVLAIEIDRDLASLLRSRFADSPNFTLIEGDALSTQHALHPHLPAAITRHRASSAASPVKLIANLPYNIASPLVVELLLAGVDLLVFTVQKEVAERLRAVAGSEAYGPLSVTVATLAEVEVLRTIPPTVFHPPPNVDSALVRLTRRPDPPADARGFAAFTRQLFAARRKMLRKALAPLSPDPSASLAAAGLDPTARCEQLTPTQLLTLFHHLSGQHRVSTKLP